ncbi:MAG: MAPEG family protein [Novosphingobium sp.]|nr:MAPEG family protein [Novosphingobium sp.]
MKEILLPATVLVVWTMIMAFWMLLDRGRILKSNNVSLDKERPGARGKEIEAIAAPGADWPGHNYNHLMEQPTLFYATTVILALSAYSTLDVVLAWAFVTLRLVHSIYQATVNKVPVRGTLFGLSSLVMMVIAVRTLLAVLALPTL